MTLVVTCLFPSQVYRGTYGISCGNTEYRDDCACVNQFSIVLDRNQMCYETFISSVKDLSYFFSGYTMKQSCQSHTNSIQETGNKVRPMAHKNWTKTS